MITAGLITRRGEGEFLSKESKDNVYTKKIESLVIEKFRGINSFEINDIKQFNLFIGLNDTCKSNILEAIWVVKCLVDDTRLISKILSRRVKRSVFNPRELWYNYLHQVTPSISMNIKGISIHVEFKTDFTFETFDLKFRTKKGHRIFKVNPYFQKIGEEGKNLEDILDEQIIKILRNMRFFDASILLLDDPVELERECAKALSTQFKDEYDPRVKRPVLTPYARGQSRHALERNDGIQIYVDDVGDGHRASHFLLLLAETLKNTILLVEEPELHQHPSAIERLMSRLCEICKQNDLQLFVTTHSPEVFKFFSRLENAQIFHTFFDEGRQVKIEQADKDSLNVLADIGWDLGYALKFEKFIVVEGVHDKEILSHLIRKLKKQIPEDLGLTIIPTGGRDNFKEIVKALAHAGRRLFILRDLDEETPDKVRQSILDSLKGLANEGYEMMKDNDELLELVHKKTKRRVSINKNDIIPVGETDKFPRLKRHSMEDYLLEILITQPHVAKELGINKNLTYDSIEGKSAKEVLTDIIENYGICLLYTSPSPRDRG